MEAADAVCLCISLVTGPMIRETVEIARAIKAWKPDFPIILGGWHPSLLPTQTLQAPYIDYVVRGQGEDSLLELIQHIESGAAPDFVTGIGFKRDGKLILTPERPLKPLIDMPPKAYQIADFDAYERGCGRRWAMYTSSLACPFHCSYCTNANGLRPQVERALPRAVRRRDRRPHPPLQPRHALGRRRQLHGRPRPRARHLRAKALVQAPAQTSSGACRPPPTSSRGSPSKTLPLLRRSGLHQVCQGVDSGSPKVLAAMNKTFQDYDSIYQSVERCLAANIRPSFNIMFAYPWRRPHRNANETISFMMDVCRRFHRSGVPQDQYLRLPYPGTPVMKRAFELGIEVPKTLEGWADFFPRYTVLPWLPKWPRASAPPDYARILPHRFQPHPYRGRHAHANYASHPESNLHPRPLAARPRRIRPSRRTLAQHSTQEPHRHGKAGRRRQAPRAEHLGGVMLMQTRILLSGPLCNPQREERHSSHLCHFLGKEPANVRTAPKGWR